MKQNTKQISKRKRKPLYPGTAEAEAERKRKKMEHVEEEPDFIGSAPNYDKFEAMGWSVEQTLVWLNID